MLKKIRTRSGGRKFFSGVKAQSPHAGGLGLLPKKPKTNTDVDSIETQSKIQNTIILKSTQ